MIHLYYQQIKYMTNLTRIIFFFTAWLVSACSANNTYTTDGSSKESSQNLSQLLSSAEFQWRNIEQCYAKSTNWGTYCLKIEDDQILETNTGKMRYLYLEGVPLLASNNQDTPLPRAFSLIVMQQKNDRWEIQYSPELQTLSAPARIAKSQFIALGENYYGYLQRLFFSDYNNIFHEKTLLSYLGKNNIRYTLIDTGMNDVYGKALADTVCNKTSEHYNEMECRDKATIVGSAIGVNQHHLTESPLYPLLVDCKGTRHGMSADCRYGLIYIGSLDRYLPDRTIPWLQTQIY
ncbi:Uncharacterised protein [Suttonella ornithocola]|uniref:Lipoprotein n=2 Tax=Suttonella ornithocola TaxID=279832 RepID=A0A380MTR9_9GAMM|nr:Uncharacterised protein [Suttonella ornithocola]